RLAAFAALAAAFFRTPAAGLRARNRPRGSFVAVPCCLPQGPRGRETSFPADRAKDLAQAIDYGRNYRQNRADFGTETKILPDLRETRAPPASEHTEPQDAVATGSMPAIFAFRAGGRRPLRLGRRRRVDHPADLGDLVGRKAAAPGMLVN